MQDNHRDESDNILDGALAAYSTQEPLDGIEDRVLARVLAEGPAFKFELPRWVFVAAAAGVALFATALGLYRESPKHPQAQEVGQALSPANSVTARIDRRKRLSHVVHSETRRHTVHALPKLQEFPAPVPLTPEERALRALVNQSPDEAQKVALEQAQADVPPIQIQAIQIEPLHIDGLPEEP